MNSPISGKNVRLALAIIIGAYILGFNVFLTVTGRGFEFYSRLHQFLSGTAI